MKCVFVASRAGVVNSIIYRTKCFRPLPQAQNWRNANMCFKDFSKADIPPKEPWGACMPRTVLGFRPISFCSSSEMSQEYHTHGSSIVPSECTPHSCLHCAGSADTQKVRLIAPWRFLVGFKEDALTARALCGRVRDTACNEQQDSGDLVMWNASLGSSGEHAKPASESSHVWCKQPCYKGGAPGSSPPMIMILRRCHGDCDFSFGLGLLLGLCSLFVEYESECWKFVTRGS